MSEICCEVLRLGTVKPHPNADRLEIAEVMGTQCVVPKGVYRTGMGVVWIPPGMLINAEAAEHLGVADYLKEAKYPGDLVATKCRVAACRLRGEVSYGIITHAKLDMCTGDHIDHLCGAVKYEPPTTWGPNGANKVRGFNGDAAPDYPEFHRYTDIQNFYKYADVIPEGTPVRITEKLHGTNCRLGLINHCGDFSFMAGSHKVNWKPQTEAGKVPLWWEYMTEEAMYLLTELANEQHSVILFGEIFGPGVQDLDYGQTEKRFRAFDIAVNGQYLNYDRFRTVCAFHGVDTVPLLYEGPYSKAVLEQYTHGPTALHQQDMIKSKFKGREGVVVTPLEEMTHPKLGRVILKSISADYLDRKNPQDN